MVRCRTTKSGTTTHVFVRDQPHFPTKGPGASAPIILGHKHMPHGMTLSKQILQVTKLDEGNFLHVLPRSQPYYGPKNCDATSHAHAL